MKFYTFLLICLATSLFTVAQQTDIQHYHFSLTLNDSTNRITGTAEITTRFLQDTRILRLDLAGPSVNDTGMTVTAVQQDRNEVLFSQDSASLTLSVNAVKGSTHTYTITYAGIPRDGLIISTNRYGSRTFFSDNWPDRAHHWIPCTDHPSDKATVDMTVTAPAHYQVVANGRKTGETILPGHLKITRYREKIPLPTKVIAVGVADFAIDHPADVNGIPVYSYVFRENKDRGFQDYTLAVNVLRYFNGKIGPYPYEKLANIQSKTIFGGMENASAIFYAERSVGSRSIEELLAHEIAHQWFGDAVTEKGWQHFWLSEGFASYMTHLYMESKYGTDTLKKELADDRTKIIAFGKKRHTPIVDTTVTGQYMQLLNPNSYEKGAWVLHMLRRRLTDGVFWKGIRSYYGKYNGKNADTDDFRRVMEQVSGQDLKTFFRQWLYTAGMPILDIRVRPADTQDSLIVKVEQRQDPLFDFVLEYTTGNNWKVQQADITQRVTQFSIPAGTAIRFDPNINLLAEINLIQ